MFLSRHKKQIAIQNKHRTKFIMFTCSSTHTYCRTSSDESNFLSWLLLVINTKTKKNWIWGNELRHPSIFPLFFSNGKTYNFTICATPYHYQYTIIPNASITANQQDCVLPVDVNMVRKIQSLWLQAGIFLPHFFDGRDIHGITLGKRSEGKMSCFT